MDNEMLERMAEACFQTLCPGIRYTEEDKIFYKEAQVAVIKAMREPTEKMKLVDTPDMPAGGEAADIWYAMIDCIIK